MTEEVKNVEKQSECYCRKRAKDILTIAIGSFVGVYCALSLFAALHKPHFPKYPVMGGGMYQHRMMPGHMGHHGFAPRGEKMRPDKFKKDFEAPKAVENKE